MMHAAYFTHNRAMGSVTFRPFAPADPVPHVTQEVIVSCVAKLDRDGNLIGLETLDTDCPLPLFAGSLDSVEGATIVPSDEDARHAIEGTSPHDEHG